MYLGFENDCIKPQATYRLAMLSRKTLYRLCIVEVAKLDTKRQTERELSLLYAHPQILEIGLKRFVKNHISVSVS